MKVIFSDLQDHSNPMHGTAIHNGAELENLLGALRERQPFVCEIAGENEYSLKMGIGPDLGCVQYSPSNGDTPYLMAVNLQEYGQSDYVEFLMGDTPTPISRRFCFPLDTVKAIVMYFIETRQRMPTIPWEEI